LGEFDVTAFRPNACMTGSALRNVPTIMRVGDGASLMSVGVIKMPSVNARSGCSDTSTNSISC
jgi:hypothetical protein